MDPKRSNPPGSPQRRIVETFGVEIIDMSATAPANTTAAERPAQERAPTELVPFASTLRRIA